MPIPLVFIFIYSLGRWGIVDARDFLKAVTLGCGFLDWWLSSAVCYASTSGMVLYQFWPDLTADGATSWVWQITVWQPCWRPVSWADWASFLPFPVPLALFRASDFASRHLCYLSRGSIVGTCAGILVLGAMNSKMLKRHWKIVVALFLLVAVCITQSPALSRRIRSIVNLTTNSSNIGRLEIWHVSWEMLKDHLLFGIGPGHFGSAYEAYRPEGYITPKAPQLVLIPADGLGLVGFLLFFG